jgi:hypothetical protein
MKFQAFLIFTLWITGCNSNKDNGSHTHDEAAGGNQALYDEVMGVHDEVMPKMNDIYSLKEKLKKEIADAPDMVQEKRRDIEAAIRQLDSASEEMMVWMRNFNPLPDSLGEEKARRYLEEQRDEVNKVKNDMLQAIDEAEGLSQ